MPAFEKSLTNMTLLHYPPRSPGAAGFGIHPHKDTDAFTIIWPDPAPGFSGQSVNAGEISAEVWRTNWPVETPRDEDTDLGTVPHAR